MGNSIVSEEKGRGYKQVEGVISMEKRINISIFI